MSPGTNNCPLGAGESSLIENRSFRLCRAWETNRRNFGLEQGRKQRFLIADSQQQSQGLGTGSPASASAGKGLPHSSSSLAGSKLRMRASGGTQITAEP